jgi:nucleotide-binding universal stress UspA family protein
MIKRVLVPIDLSEASLASLNHAVDLAERYEARLLLLHVVQPIHDAALAGEFIAERTAFARVELDRLVERLAAQHVSCDTVLRVGIPYVEIVRAAESHDADLIVMATNGRTGLSRMKKGSVAEKVVRTSECPVLTVRRPKVSVEVAPDVSASAA